jgi:hypothetical protein
MAVTSVILDIKANTDRALGQFKQFSSQLDNKFLVSGLKLDVVRSALGQINREFQKAIGEQGLQAGQSLRAAQNQAALLTQTFKSFSANASMDMSEQFSTAFSQIAIRAGGTAKDIQKTLAATPFISTNLSQDMRKALGEGVLSFQRDFRRAGVTDDFANIARQFLMGQVTAQDLIQSGDAGQSFLGSQIAQRTGTVSLITNAEQRSRALLDILSDKKFQDQIQSMAQRAYGFRSIIEDLNSYLFDPQAGIFGILRQVTMSVSDKTTIFKETESLINSVFGRQGLFVNFFKQIGAIFGLEDPLKLIIIGVRFITRQFNALNEFINSPAFQAVIKSIQTIFQRTKEFFESVYNAVTSGAFDPTSINAQIREAGESLRNFIKKIANVISNEDISSEAGFSTSIIGTLVEEVGLTLITLVKEIGGALLPKAGTIATRLLGELGPALGRLVVGLFTSGPIVGTIAAIIAARAGISATRGVGGLLQAGQRFIDPRRGGIGGGIRRYLNLPGAQNIGELGAEVGPATATFQREMLMHVRRIASCVCRPDVDLSGPSGGRQRTSSLGYSGPRQRVALRSDGPLELQPPRRRFGDRVRGLGSGALGFGRDIINTDADSAVPGYIDRSRGNVAARFNRRYGSGGTRRMLGRGMRGFGRGALIAGLGLGAIGMLGGGAAQATEFDPETGEPIQTPGQQQMAGVGSVLSGGLEGAMTGAMLGSFIPGIGTAAGAVIGGVIGGVVPLLDEGTRKGVSSFVSGIGKSLQDAGKGISDAASRGVNWVKDGFSSIGKWFSDIDWKTILINALVPGGQFTIQGLQGIADFASKLNIFDGIKSGIDTITGAVEGIRDNLPGWLGGRRAVGGPVTRGMPFLVGERGPELFMPSGDGSIVSNLALGQMANNRGPSSPSVSANFNVTINLTGGAGSTAQLANELEPAVIAILDKAWNMATASSVSRGALA